MKRSWRILLVGIVVLLPSGCATTPISVTTSETPIAPTATSAPALPGDPSPEELESAAAPLGPPITSVDGETAQEAATRLVAEVVRMKVEDGAELDRFEGAAAGTPQAFAAGYDFPDPVPASWLVDDEWSAKPTDLFDAMRPAPLLPRDFSVPVMKDGRMTASLDFYLDDGGHWRWSRINAGEYFPAEEAKLKLTRALGQEAGVRVAIFRPSGLVFAVGWNGERLAAVYLALVSNGPGVHGFDGVKPEPGALLSSDQLAELLARPGGWAPVKALVIVLAAVGVILLVRGLVLRMTKG